MRRVSRAPDAWPRALLDAALITAGCALVALGVNALRADGIPLVAAQAYEILVPCPETSGEVDTVAPTDPALGASTTLLVDARAPEAYAAWHLPGARSVPYDYLEPVCSVRLREVASSGAQRVVVYGDGEDPDSGEQLGRELSGKGIRNVGFVVGGAPALRVARGEEAP